MLRDEATILDFEGAARRALSFVAGMDKNLFLSDEKTKSAVVRQLEVMGEASKRLSSEFREQHATIPWREIARMRDRLIHGYEVVDYDLVWSVLEQDIPKLLRNLGSLSGTADETQRENI